MNPPTTHDVAAAGVVGLAGFGKFLATIEPALADISYLAAIIVAVVTLWQKFKRKS